ncbi:MAG: family 4 glycosyl hydrolase [Candidatus Zipacnadales bacterium]
MREAKLVIIGAGSVTFTAGLVADLLASKIEANWTVGLVDINEEALVVADGLVRRMVQHKDLPITVQSSTDRRDILPNATFVVTTIAVGGREGWRKDIEVPLQHGIYQPVGDTVGPGGISRALRQIPAMLDIAHDVAQLCPQVRFFNYANPMAAICRAVNKATPVEVVGLCHGVQGTLRYLCDKLSVPYAEVSALYLGMNHLTWITHLTHQGESLWPRLNALLLNLEPTDNPFSWELYRAYGAFPAVLDRHVVEFFPEWFCHDAEYGQPVVEAILEVIRGGQQRWEQRQRQARGEEPLEEGLFQRTLGEHEALLPIIASIMADRQEIFPMNVPNRSLDGIPLGFILEMPVLATAAGCIPMALPSLPPGLLAWITEALYGVEITVEAAIHGDRNLLVQALLYDRSVSGLKAAEALADDLLAAHKADLPRFA